MLTQNQKKMFMLLDDSDLNIDLNNHILRKVGSLLRLTVSHGVYSKTLSIYLKNKTTKSEILIQNKGKMWIPIVNQCRCQTN